MFIGRTGAEAETPVFWSPHAKGWLIGKTLMLGGIGGRRRRGWQRMRWLDAITNSMDMSLSKLGVGDGQGGLASCGSWGRKESDSTERLNWTECSSCLMIFLFHVICSLKAKVSLLYTTYSWIVFYLFFKFFSHSVFCMGSLMNLNLN